MPKLIKASKEFDESKAKTILKDIDKNEKEFEKHLKKSNAAQNKMFFPKKNIPVNEFNKLATEYKKHSDEAIKYRKEVNKLAEQFFNLTGKETFRAHELGL